MNNFKRKVDYLRISVTDRCNLRCMYCIPQAGITSMPHEELLTFEEVLRLARIFASLGVSKIRFTGGEPLVRRGIINLIKSFACIKGIEELSLTTNGTLLSFYAGELKKAGIKRINISLDTLKEDRFRRITAIGSLRSALEGIYKARDAGFSSLKLNMVVMKGVNDDEILDFVNFALSERLILRFIELMKVTPLWKEDYFIPIEKVRKICETRFRLRRIEDLGPGPATYYEVGKDGILGFIDTNEDNCRRCTRLRLTSTGELKLCLYERDPFCLRSLLRQEITDEEIKDIIEEKLELKQDLDHRCGESSKFYMCKIGG